MPTARRRTFPTALLILASSAALLFVSSAARAQGPIPTPVPKGDVRINLQPVASGLTSPIDLRSAPGEGAGRLYITDQAGRVRVAQGGSVLSSPFLDVGSRLVPLRQNFDERGLLAFAFHPDYNTAGTPGFGRVYTYTSEPVASGPGTTTPIPMPVANPPAPDNHGVVAEWTVNRTTGAVDSASRRELFRYDDPQFNHNGGPFHFGPDKNLYIGIGDGGGANDTPAGHAPEGNGQALNTVMGKILRIDPLGTGGPSGQYGIPAGNPFAGGAAGARPEIYAYGFRNPFRFSFAPNGDLLVADVGQGNIEELDRVVAGGNYGWRVKEGTFPFNTDGTIGPNSPGTPPGLTDPIVQYDHDEGLSIIGGFVYRGSAIPELTGKYVFGDFSNGFAPPNGRILYADLVTGEIREFRLGSADDPLGLYVKGMGEDAAGEIYVLTTTALGPTGTTGQVFRLAAIPEPSMAAGATVLAGVALLRRRRRRQPLFCNPQSAI